MRQVLYYTAALVGAYLVLAYATGAGQLLRAAGSTYVQSVRTLQGR